MDVIIDIIGSFALAFAIGIKMGLYLILGVSAIVGIITTSAWTWAIYLRLRQELKEVVQETKSSKS